MTVIFKFRMELAYPTPYENGCLLVYPFGRHAPEGVFQMAERETGRSSEKLIAES